MTDNNDGDSANASRSITQLPHFFINHIINRTSSQPNSQSPVFKRAHICFLPTHHHPQGVGSGRVRSHQMSIPPSQPPPRLSLYKQKSWSPDMSREEAWLKRKGQSKMMRMNGNRHQRSKSLTNEDVDELKACIELGFGFDSPQRDSRLEDTLPALGLYYAVNKHYHDAVFKSSPSLSSSSSSFSDCDSSVDTTTSSPPTIFSPGENPKEVKTKLKQWAQVVACSVRQSSSR